MNYEDIAIAMIYQKWNNGDSSGLSGWDVWRRLKRVDLEPSMELIIRALHVLQNTGKVTVGNDSVMPFRYCITEDGVLAGGIACTRILRQEKKRAELPPPVVDVSARGKEAGVD
jgi:hypothetical protein